LARAKRETVVTFLSSIFHLNPAWCRVLFCAKEIVMSKSILDDRLENLARLVGQALAKKWIQMHNGQKSGKLPRVRLTRPQERGPSDHGADAGESD
jgi:hypothetical protein